MTREAGDFTGHRLHDDPLAIEVRKRPITVRVQWAAESGVLRTREGTVHYRTGDALLRDDGGYCWPVQRVRFGATYEASTAPGAGEDGRYVARPNKAYARRMDARFSVRVGHAGDVLRGEPGDWVLQYFDGSYGVVAREIFEHVYEISESSRGH